MNMTDIEKDQALSRYFNDSVKSAAKNALRMQRNKVVPERHLMKAYKAIGVKFEKRWQVDMEAILSEIGNMAYAANHILNSN